jgi:hypothetical protein
MIDVVAEGAFGIGDAVLITERNSHARSVRTHAESSTLKTHPLNLDRPPHLDLAAQRLRLSRIHAVEKRSTTDEHE